MARQRRIEMAGGIHHVMSRGNRRAEIFRDDTDCQQLLNELHTAVDRYGWRCLGYCLMINHFHFVLETPKPNLGNGMRNCLSRYVQGYNERHDTEGRMFGGRFKSVPVLTDEHFARLLRYVPLNPVNAGMCADPGEWQWSSHKLFASGTETALSAVERVEELLAHWGGAPGSRYASLLAPDSPFGGWNEARTPDPPRPSLEEMLSPATAGAMRLARNHGYRIAEIAALAGVSTSTVSRWTRQS